MTKGFLYILSNPTIPGLCKVGKTTRDPSLRVSELSGATGVASPFVLLYQQPVADADAAEAWAHRAMAARGWRHANNREFFNAPLHEIVALVFQAASAVEPDATTTQADIEEADGVNEEEALSERQQLFLLGLETLTGANGGLADRDRGMRLVCQAADMGEIDACIFAGKLLFRGQGGVAINLARAHAYLTLALEAGSTECHALLAELMVQNGQRTGALHHWKAFFDHTAYRLSHVPPGELVHERAAQYAGEHGRIYCRHVHEWRVDDGVDDASFALLAPFIEQHFQAEQERIEAMSLPPAAKTSMQIKLTIEMQVFKKMTASRPLR